LPATPEEGSGHGLGGPVNGEGQAGDLAFWQDGRWRIVSPEPGWRIWVTDAGAEHVWTGTQWVPSEAGVTEASRLGINTVADDTNRLSVKSDGVLLSHDDRTPGTGDVRLTLNRADTQTVASLIFQTGFAGNAELGVSGTGDLALRVSADGGLFRDALRVDRLTGACTFPATQGGLVGIRQFGTGVHTYQAPAGVRSLKITAIGGGGGGAGAETLSTTVYVGAGGGGAGGVVIAMARPAETGPLTVEVGEGGDGGVAAAGSAVGSRNGFPGGTTRVTGTGLNLVAGGGGGAPEDAASTGTTEFVGGAGGTASGGAINLPGQQGGGGITRASQFYQIGAGEGASGLFGTGGPYKNGDGRTGAGFGTGGSGCGMIPGSELNRRGGKGAPGAVIIEEFA
jgi:hypothetical protein